MVLYALAPAWSRSSVASFDRDTVRLLSSGSAAALRGRYARALGMRLFAPPAVLAERHALVAAELGDALSARRSYRRALSEYGEHAPLRVMLGYAHASYQLGQDREAIRMYERLLTSASELPGVRRNLAHALARRGEEPARVRSLIDGLMGDGTSQAVRAELELVRALSYANDGDRERAEAVGAACSDVATDFGDRLREELDEALDRAARPL